jgi:uncharacterized protein
MDMSPTAIVAVAIAGVFVGIVSGLIGIGGGILVIPILTVVFGFPQSKAAGTSLAMLLPPIGIFAVLTYHRAGQIHWPTAALLAGGFAVGGWIGARLVASGRINQNALRIGFAVFLIYVACLMFMRAMPTFRAAMAVALTLSGIAIGYVALSLFRRRIRDESRIGRLYHQYLARVEPNDYFI